MKLLKRILAGGCLFAIAALSFTKEAAGTELAMLPGAGADTVIFAKKDTKKENYSLENHQDVRQANIFDAGVQSRIGAPFMEITKEEKAEMEEIIAGYKNLGVAKVDNHLNIRETPSLDSKRVGQMPKNAGCEILSVDGEWAKIRSGKVEGYVNTEFLYMGEEAKRKAREVLRLMATVNTVTLRVREEPSESSGTVTLIPEGEELEVIEEVDEWVKIAIDNEEGYISKGYVDIAERLDKAITMTEIKYGEGVSDVKVSLVKYAKQFVGNPYVWGGVSLTKGADCSGFVLSVYKKFGVSLPRTSGAQASVGKKVSLAEAQPGDLIFYGNGKAINHVAIYIGGGQVVHASSARTGIKISNATYRSPVTIKRVL